MDGILMAPYIQAYYPRLPWELMQSHLFHLAVNTYVLGRHVGGWIQENAWAWVVGPEVVPAFWNDTEMYRGELPEMTQALGNKPDQAGAWRVQFSTVYKIED